MFKKLFSFLKKDDVNGLHQIDLSLNYSRLSEFEGYIKDKQYQHFETEYDNVEWDAQTLLNEGIGLNKNYATAIMEWVQLRPDSYVANLFAGVSKTSLAWIARTSAIGASVSKKNANKFLTLLEAAADYLNRADELNPANAEVCARMIRVYMGLGIDRENTKSFFDAAIRIVPNHLMAHLMMANYLNPKWGGSIEAMHEFVQEKNNVTASSLLITLRLFAITEEWLYYDLNGEEKKHAQFFASTDLKLSVFNFYSGYKEEEDGKLLIPYVYNYFAFLFWMTDNKELARQLIKRINNKMTIYPWAYIDIVTNDQLQRL